MKSNAPSGGTITFGTAKHFFLDKRDDLSPDFFLVLNGYKGLLDFHGFSMSISLLFLTGNATSETSHGPWAPQIVRFNGWILGNKKTIARILMKTRLNGVMSCEILRRAENMFFFFQKN